MTLRLIGAAVTVGGMETVVAVDDGELLASTLSSVDDMIAG